jgi:threonyl-tRNA synthetase
MKKTMNDKYQDFKEQMPDWVQTEAEFELYKLRHSAEHIFNQAVEELFPGQVLRAMGPAIKTGFYNDSRWGFKPSEEQFAQIEERMREIAAANLPFVRKDISEAEAREMFKENPFKQEFIDEFVAAGSPLTVYYTGNPGGHVFVDLCRGPHVDSTGQVTAFKLLSVAGAYWRGDEKNEMLTRIYGTAFPNQVELDAYLEQQEEAKRRDHRKLARELDLIVFSELVGAGLPMYTPRGSKLRNAVYNYSRELNRKIGYHEVNTPNFNRAELFKVSGHYDKYKDDMFRVVSQYSEEEMFYKPMNCPQHTQIFASQIRSYKDLPFRVADFSNLARDERPGEMHGIFRSRVFTQDDGHAFVREDQIGEEFRNVAGAIVEALQVYGMKYWIRLSLRDPNAKEKYLGDDATWERAESTLKALVKDMGYEYKEAPGEAAIYGPKMDFMAFDSIGREWQISTIQIDMNMPVRFGLKYTDRDGSEKTPVMIHRAIVGSERFIGIIIEHYGGAFPLWMAPEQVRILPVNDAVVEYAKQVQKELFDAGLWVEIDDSDERLGNKIRKGQQWKVPYMVIIGGQEAESNTVAVRTREGVEYKQVQLAEFITQAQDKLANRSTDLTLRV